MEKNFDQWNAKKQVIHEEGKRAFCYPREIWWCTFGINIGFEQDGIGSNFRRPIVVVKGFSKDAFFGVALTSREKEGEYYFPVGRVDGKTAVAILSQVRFIDTKRLIEKIGVLDDVIFQEMKSALCRTLFDDCLPLLSQGRGRSPCYYSILPLPNLLSNAHAESYNIPMTIRIKRFDKDLPLPRRQTDGAAAFDLVAREATTIAPHAVGYIPLNIAVETPPGHFLMLAARSSTHKKGLMPANGFGIIDPDFSGDNDEIKLAAYNFTDAPVVVERGERIAQAMFVTVAFAGGEGGGETGAWEEVDTMPNKTRGGFGSTGAK
jgi:deoxyuridine 5'-triphosphate nucleotidohydrolase